MGYRWSKFRQQYDQENRMWVAESADRLAFEMKHQSFMRGLLKRRNQKRTIYDQYGRPIAQIHVHDTGNTEHEWDNWQDAVARPEPMRPKPRLDSSGRRLRLPFRQGA